jgi:hypothetical protein
VVKLGALLAFVAAASDRLELGTADVQPRITSTDGLPAVRGL